MPNWCLNVLTLEGRKSDVISLLNKGAAKNRYGDQCEFTFHAFIPVPPEVAQSSEAWYEWQTGNWGTKWDAHDPHTSLAKYSPLEVLAFDAVPSDADIREEVRFDTAWAPPHPIVEEIARQFPSIMIYHQWWIELGNGVGQATYKEGELLGRDYYDECSPEGRDITVDVAGYDPLARGEDE